MPNCPEKERLHRCSAWERLLTRLLTFQRQGHGPDSVENCLEVVPVTAATSSGSSRQTVRRTVDFPQVQFLNKVLDMPVVVQRLVPGSDNAENSGISKVFARRLIQTVRRSVWSEGFLALLASSFALRPAGRECPCFSPRRRRRQQQQEQPLEQPLPQ